MKFKLKSITVAAMIAAVYVALTYVSALMGLGFGQVQLRLSEALCVLAAFTPAAIPGLTLGCAIANFASEFGVVDVVCGSLATLLASTGAYLLREVKFKGIAWLSPLPSVVLNAVIVGAEIAVFTAQKSLFLQVFAVSAAWVSVGQIAACYLLGLPLYVLIERCAPLKKLLMEQ